MEMDMTTQCKTHICMLWTFCGERVEIEHISCQHHCGQYNRLGLPLKKGSEAKARTELGAILSIKYKLMNLPSSENLFVHFPSAL